MMTRTKKTNAEFAGVLWTRGKPFNFDDVGCGASQLYSWWFLPSQSTYVVPLLDKIGASLTTWT